MTAVAVDDDTRLEAEAGGDGEVGGAAALVPAGAAAAAGETGGGAPADAPAVVAAPEVLVRLYTYLGGAAKEAFPQVRFALASAQRVTDGFDEFCGKVGVGTDAIEITRKATVIAALGHGDTGVSKILADLGFPASDDEESMEYMLHNRVKIACFKLAFDSIESDLFPSSFDGQDLGVKITKRIILRKNGDGDSAKIVAEVQYNVRKAAEGDETPTVVEIVNGGIVGDATAGAAADADEEALPGDVIAQGKVFVDFTPTQIKLPSSTTHSVGIMLAKSQIRGRVVEDRWQGLGNGPGSKQAATFSAYWNKNYKDPETGAAITNRLRLLRVLATKSPQFKTYIGFKVTPESQAEAERLPREVTPERAFNLSAHPTELEKRGLLQLINKRRSLRSAFSIGTPDIDGDTAVLLAYRFPEDKEMLEAIFKPRRFARAIKFSAKSTADLNLLALQYQTVKNAIATRVESEISSERSWFGFGESKPGRAMAIVKDYKHHSKLVKAILRGRDWCSNVKFSFEQRFDIAHLAGEARLAKVAADRARRVPEEAGARVGDGAEDAPTSTEETDPINPSLATNTLLVEQLGETVYGCIWGMCAEAEDYKKKNISLDQRKKVRAQEIAEKLITILQNPVLRAAVLQAARPDDLVAVIDSLFPAMLEFGVKTSTAARFLELVEGRERKKLDRLLWDRFFSPSALRRRGIDDLGDDLTEKQEAQNAWLSYTGVLEANTYTDPVAHTVTTGAAAAAASGGDADSPTSAFARWVEDVTNWKFVCAALYNKSDDTLGTITKYSQGKATFAGDASLSHDNEATLLQMIIKSRSLLATLPIVSAPIDGAIAIVLLRKYPENEKIMRALLDPKAGDTSIKFTPSQSLELAIVAGEYAGANAIYDNVEDVLERNPKLLSKVCKEVWKKMKQIAANLSSSKTKSEDVRKLGKLLGSEVVRDALKYVTPEDTTFEFLVMDLLVTMHKSKVDQEAVGDFLDAVGYDNETKRAKLAEKFRDHFCVREEKGDDGKKVKKIKKCFKAEVAAWFRDARIFGDQAFAGGYVQGETADALAAAGVGGVEDTYAAVSSTAATLDALDAAGEGDGDGDHDEVAVVVTGDTVDVAMPPAAADVEGSVPDADAAAATLAALPPPPADADDGAGVSALGDDDLERAAVAPA